MIDKSRVQGHSAKMSLWYKNRSSKTSLEQSFFAGCPSRLVAGKKGIFRFDVRQEIYIRSSCRNAETGRKSCGGTEVDISARKIFRLCFFYTHLATILDAPVI
jgi:hypothetical protein